MFCRTAAANPIVPVYRHGCSALQSVVFLLPIPDAVAPAVYSKTPRYGGQFDTGRQARSRRSPATVPVWGAVSRWTRGRRKAGMGGAEKRRSNSLCGDQLFDTLKQAMFFGIGSEKILELVYIAFPNPYGRVLIHVLLKLRERFLKLIRIGKNRIG
jgi:hypothetical protein